MSRQEEAFDYVTKTFIKLLQQDDRIAYEHKRSVIAFYEDLFAHEGVRNNMIQAFSNFLWEIDKRIEAARKAGIMSVDEVITLFAGENYADMTMDGGVVKHTLQGLLNMENSPEENISESDVADMDLGEVGGGHEDDTPLI